MAQRFINWLTVLTFFMTSIGTVFFFVFFYYGRGLPDYGYLHTYEPMALNRIGTATGETLRIFAQERRIFVPLAKIPARVVNSFLLAEDKHFYYHCGLDIQGILRAVVTNSTQGAWSTRPLGGSTITQQVAKNFLVGNERSFDRKAKEAIMAVRLEFALGKERILELYLNQIYLGMGAYGVAAAALTYFNKPLEELSISETAFLAALPKAPSFYPSQKELTRGKARRNWVIDRLYEEGFLTEQEARNAQAEPLAIRPANGGDNAAGNRPDYFSEHVRLDLTSRFGEKYISQGGLGIQTTLVPVLQDIAQSALKAGLIAYDRRHGWRGPLEHIEIDLDFAEEWQKLLQNSAAPAGLGEWKLAIVLETTPLEAKIGLKNGEQGIIPLESLTWARKNLPNQLLGPEIRHPQEVVQPGDIIAVSPIAGQAYSLEQVPDVTGGIVVLDPHTGHVLAMAGGYDFAKSQFNCATQARRQPGSAFKPFVYLTALEQGYTPETRILDAPVIVSMGGKMGVYAPKNINHKYKGLLPLKLGLIDSRNVMTVRLAQKIGIKRIEKTAVKFGVVEELPNQLAMALGAGETTLLKMTAAYGMIANGGRHISPAFINEVKDRYGQVIYNAPLYEEGAVYHKPVADAAAVAQLTRIMEGVIQLGTARSLISLGRPIAGKTGTTNDYKDAWFIGFTPDLVVGVFTGFAAPRTLGPKETGSRVAVPIFKKFMEEALKDQPVKFFG